MSGIHLNLPDISITSRTKSQTIGKEPEIIWFGESPNVNFKIIISNMFLKIDDKMENVIR